MIFKVFLLIVLATAVLSRPQGQLLTFENGKFGVNFGGYHAEAGLGGLLTGNAAHGGLSASAGTPYGQQAGAGLGGGVDGQGKSSGGAYAGASAGYGVGASAALGGGINGEGGAGGVGAESHVPGKVTKVVKLAQLNPSASFDATKEINEVPSSNIATRFNVEESDSTHKEFQTVAVAQAPVSTPVIVKTVHKKKFHHHQPAVVYEKRISYEPVQVHQQVEHRETLPQIPQQTHTNTNLDYRNFFDFGFFSNIAAGFGGPHATYSQQQPQVVYEKSYAPVTYEKRVQVHHKDIPTYVQKEVEVVKRVDAGVDSQVIVHKEVPQVYKTKSVAYSTGGNFFNDIFNIPISALTSVNRFLNNNVGNVHVQKTVGIY